MAETSEAIEDIILSNDRRNISLFRPALPRNFCHEAGRLLMENPGPVLIITGFYIPDAGAPETDGPPGAIAIARALTMLRDEKVLLVTDELCAPLLRSLCGHEYETLVFPLAGAETSDEYARSLIETYRPATVVSVERCGVTRDGFYLNMAGDDISAYHAKIDRLFHYTRNTIGIGDYGNEIGMGNIAEVIRTVRGSSIRPAATKVSRLIIASVSNWGAYGLVAAVSRLSGRNLLPPVDDEEDLLRRLVASGAVDGITKRHENSVDALPWGLTAGVLKRLHRVVGPH